MAEPGTLGGALDQAGNVRDDELAAVRRVDGAEDGLQRRERVVGDLRLRIGDAREERRLPRVGESDERRVGEQLEVQLELGLFAGQSGLGEARSLQRGRREPAVAASARAAAADDRTRAGMGEVGDEMTLAVEHLRAHGDTQLHVVAVRAVLPRAASRPTTPCGVLPPGAKRRQVAQIRIGDEDDVASRAAVAAVRTAARHVLLAPEAERAVSTTPGDRDDAGAVVEHRPPASRLRRPCGVRRSSGTTRCRRGARRSCRRGRCPRPSPA